MWETQVWSLGWEDLLEKEMTTHSSTLAWKIPWTEEPGRLQSIGSQSVGHDWATSLSLWLKSNWLQILATSAKYLHINICVVFNQMSGLTVLTQRTTRGGDHHSCFTWGNLRLSATVFMEDTQCVWLSQNINPGCPMPQTSPNLCFFHSILHA